MYSLFILRAKYCGKFHNKRNSCCGVFAAKTQYEISAISWADSQVIFQIFSISVNFYWIKFLHHFLLSPIIFQIYSEIFFHTCNFKLHLFTTKVNFEIHCTAFMKFQNNLYAMSDSPVVTWHLPQFLPWTFPKAM